MENPEFIQEISSTQENACTPKLHSFSAHQIIQTKIALNPQNLCAQTDKTHKNNQKDIEAGKNVDVKQTLKTFKEFIFFIFPVDMVWFGLIWFGTFTTFAVSWNVICTGNGSTEY